MAKIKKVKQAKVKVIEEERFRIIKSENGKKEEKEKRGLEEDIESGNIGFSSSGTRTAPILIADNSRLERTAETAPPMKNIIATESKEVKYMNVYDKVRYSQGYSDGVVEERAEPLAREMRQSGLLLNSDEIFTRTQITPRREQIGHWHELKADSRAEREDAVISAERLEESKNLPFQEKRKYKSIR